MWQGLIHRLSRRFDAAVLYHVSTGIKCTNQLVRSEQFQLFARGEVFAVPAEQLRLGFDGLEDEHTLLGVPVRESPHFDLVGRLQGNHDISASPYARRAARGALDFRPARKLKMNFFDGLKEDYDRALARVRTGDSEPLMITAAQGSYYIADGKHRAAVCAWLGVPCPCVDVSAVIHDSFYRWIHRKMLRRPARFAKHLRWFADLNGVA